MRSSCNRLPNRGRDLGPGGSLPISWEVKLLETRQRTSRTATAPNRVVGLEKRKNTKSSKGDIFSSVDGSPLTEPETVVFMD